MVVEHRWTLTGVSKSNPSFSGSQSSTPINWPFLLHLNQRLPSKTLQEVQRQQERVCNFKATRTLTAPQLCSELDYAQTYFCHTARVLRQLKWSPALHVSTLRPILFSLKLEEIQSKTMGLHQCRTITRSKPDLSPAALQANLSLLDSFGMVHFTLTLSKCVSLQMNFQHFQLISTSI